MIYVYVDLSECLCIFQSTHDNVSYFLYTFIYLVHIDVYFFCSSS